MTIQRSLAIAFLVVGWLSAGVTNGNLNKPFNEVGAFLSVAALLCSIAISVIR